MSILDMIEIAENFDPILFDTSNVGEIWFWEYYTTAAESFNEIEALEYSLNNLSTSSENYYEIGKLMKAIEIYQYRVIHELNEAFAELDKRNEEWK